MKSKVYVKKLTLNKKTIADLKSGKMREVYGGGDITVPATPPIGCTLSCGTCEGGNNRCPWT